MDAVTGFFAQQSPVVLWGLGGVLAVLTLAVAITALLPVFKPAGDFTNLRQRIARYRSSPCASSCRWPRCGARTG